MKKSYVTICIVIILIAILGCVFLSYLASESPGEKTTVTICVDNPITVETFIDEIKNHPYFEGYDNDTLTWLKSIPGNYIVFSSNESYYIMSTEDENDLPIEYATDVSIYDVCDCEIVEKMQLGSNLGDVALIKNVEFKEQIVHYSYV